MRIRQISLKNYRCFEERTLSFPSQFAVVTGRAGQGKTSLLNAIATGLSPFVTGLEGVADHHTVFKTDARSYSDASREEIQRGALASIELTIEIEGREFSWKRELFAGQDKPVTTAEIITPAELGASIRKGPDEVGGAAVVPVVAYFEEPKFHRKESDQILGFDRSNSIGMTLSRDGSRLAEWIARNEPMDPKAGHSPGALGAFMVLQNFFQKDRLRPYFIAGRPPRFYSRSEGDQVVPFSLVGESTSQLFALVGNLARKACLLNPHINPSEAPKVVPGIVIVDNLESQQHPCEQRRLIDKLTGTFPRIQFITSSNSPFVVQSLKDGDLINLDPSEPANYAGRGIEEIARFVFGIEMPEMSHRYKEMLQVARTYFQLLESAEHQDTQRKQELRQRLQIMTAPYADNPAYHALLEQKLNLLDDNSYAPD